VCAATPALPASSSPASRPRPRSSGRYEEVGIGLRSLRYEGSQSWPYPGSLMLGFSAVADAGQELILDPAEIDDARWFTRAEMTRIVAGDEQVGLPMRSSIARYLIENWLGQ
jgi:NAD+ diphosphatase